MWSQTRSRHACAYSLSVVLVLGLPNLDVIHAVGIGMHHGNDGVKPNWPSDDAIVRHDDHKGRLHVALDRLADGIRRALPLGELHDASPLESALLSAHARDGLDVLAI